MVQKKSHLLNHFTFTKPYPSFFSISSCMRLCSLRKSTVAHVPLVVWSIARAIQQPMSPKPKGYVKSHVIIGRRIVTEIKEYAATEAVCPLARRILAQVIA